MKFALLAALFVTIGAAPAAPIPLAASLTAHVPVAVMQHTARFLAAAQPTRTMQLAISLPLHNEAQLHALVGAMYDPASPLYHRYLRTAEFTARFGPSIADYQKLLRFAVGNNLHPNGLAANRRVLDVEGSVADVERALHVTIGLYAHPTEPRAFYAPDREPTTTAGVSILHISGLDNFTRPTSHFIRGGGTNGDNSVRAATSTGSGPHGNFLGSDMRAAYYGGTRLTGAGQSIGLFEYAGYNLADVSAYFTKVKQPQSVPIVGVSLNGASLNCSGDCDDSEQVLDIQEAISMAPGLKKLVVYVGNSDVSILNRMASDDTSKTLSCSWGWDPDAAEVDPIFEEMALQGQSFLVATGDYGYHLLEGAVWPADDQFVTAVGGTDLRTAGRGGAWQSETGWADSGGGPSPDGIALPAYQLPFVTAANAGSTTYRNVPDVAAQANTNFYSCYDGGCYTGNGGTSYAAPIWAGYLALANQLADMTNQEPVGWLNPPIYAIGASSMYHAVFHDQTAGYNGRYWATPGFDLVTGFGSPRGDALIDALVPRR